MFLSLDLTNTSIYLSGQRIIYNFHVFVKSIAIIERHVSPTNNPLSLHQYL